MGTRTLLAVALLLLAGGAEASPGSVQRGRTCTLDFRVLPYLTHVTTSAIRINMIPDDSFDLRVSLALPNRHYGTSGQVIQTGAVADTRTHLVAAPNATFAGLTAGTQFKYLVECRANATSPWQVVQKAYFKTLQTDPAATVRAIVFGDDHTVAMHRFHFCADPDGIANDAETGRSVDRVKHLRQSLENIATQGGDFLVNGGDTAMQDTGSVDADTGVCEYVRENGDVVALSQAESDDQTEQEARWEVQLSYWQPIAAYLPIFSLLGNHEAVWGFGGAGAAKLCNNSQNLANSALVAYNNMLGNYNDAYDNGTGVDLDGDTVVEDQRDGTYFEWASGSLRWFKVDTMRHTADTAPGADPAPATLFTGFVARTADTPAATFGSVPSVTAPMDGTDTYEDNVTLGGTQTQWLVTQMGAAGEAFKAVISHRITGGINSQACYFYSRGSITTRDDDGDGHREVTESWDPDGDGDVMDEHYIAALMAAESAQIRFTAHDHMHSICRKDGIHYLSLGVPTCYGTVGTDTEFLSECTHDWYQSIGRQGAQGTLVQPGISALVNARVALLDSYDCDEDGFLDADPFQTDSPFSPLAVSNQGITGTNGTLNKGFGVLTVNGATNMEWKWIVTDLWDAERNNDPIINYGPIVP